MKNINETLEDIKLKAKAARISWITYRLLFIAAGVMLLISGWTAALLMIAANFLLYWLLVRRTIDDYDTELNSASIRFGLCADAKNRQFTDSDGLSEGKLEKLKILPVSGNRVICMSARDFPVIKRK